MARDAPAAGSGGSAGSLPNLVTIVGRGVPSNFELAVDGDLDLVGGDPPEATIRISNGVAEGGITDGVCRFRFDGELAAVQFLDWDGAPAPDSPHTPTVHADYDDAARCDDAARYDGAARCNGAAR